MKKLFYVFAMVGAVLLTSCDPNSLTPTGDATKLWPAGGEETGHWGFIDANGKMVIPADYMEAHGFSCGWSFVVTEDDEEAFIDKDNKQHSLDGKYPLSDFFYYNRIIFREDGKYGLLDENFKEIVPAEYDDLDGVGDNAFVGFEDGKLWGYLDANGKEVIGADFKHGDPFAGGFAVVADGEGYGVIDEKGKYLIEPQKKYIYNLGEGLLAFESSNEKYGLWDKKGNEVLSATYNNIYPFTCGLALVEKNGKYGFINTKGEEVIACRETMAIPFSDDVTWIVKNDESFVLIDKKGETVFKLKSGFVPAAFLFAAHPFAHFHNGLGLIVNQEEGEFRYIDKQQQVVYKWQWGSLDAPARKSMKEMTTRENIIRSMSGTQYAPLFNHMEKKNF